PQRSLAPPLPAGVVHTLRPPERGVSLGLAHPAALWVIGCAPTALEELLTLDASPALVIGLPVGFVGAAESKAALRESGLPAVSNVSEKGGSAVAAAALNALLYHPVSPSEEKK
ncbi:precorrin-8X methylmutase, partial [Streptomyces sp. NPDC058964]|uniref:precorrin-8X methylmutase n=1 Tax=Streptomyces sp. NPDC058964 TaxID=3346681 RepID=UPI0036936EBA